MKTSCLDFGTSYCNPRYRANIVTDVPAEKVVAVGRLNRLHKVKEPSLSHLIPMIFQQSGLHSGHIHPAILTFTLPGYQGFDLIVSSALKHV
jgi:hypothetical protein